MTFRIALGPCNCRNRKTSELVKGMCDIVLARLKLFRSWKISQLRSLPEVESEELNIKESKINVVTFRETRTDGRTLIVVQAFAKCLRWPTYISLDRIGHLVAEGIIVDNADSITEAPDEFLWHYR